MRYLPIVLSISVLILFVPSRAAADPTLVRPVDAAAALTLTRGLDASPLIRSLVQEIEASRVIVHVMSSRELPQNIAGTTRFVTSRGGYRYLRIALSASLREHDRIAILGHELEHAAEIARSGADDVMTIQQMLERTGYQTGHNYFETGTAIKVERMVRAELRDWELSARVAAPGK